MAAFELHWIHLAPRDLVRKFLFYLPCMPLQVIVEFVSVEEGGSNILLVKESEQWRLSES